MPKACEMIGLIESGALDAQLASIYTGGKAELCAQRRRYTELLRAFMGRYGQNGEVTLYSVPGRTEIGGNHTDHNCGAVLAAAVNLDIIAVAAKNYGQVIRVCSAGFPKEDEVYLDNLAVCEDEKHTSAALVRGVAAAAYGEGCILCGMDIYTDSRLPIGGGLSSSAAFEICIGGILSEACAGAPFEPLKLAIMGRYAENVYFGKPSGLMDQAACAAGGVVSIDFINPSLPLVQNIPLDLAAQGCCLVITDTGENHAGLTDEYTAIRDEMMAVAAHFGRTVLRQVPCAQFFSDIPALRKKLGDRAVLRAIHFYEENERVVRMVSAVRANNFGAFLRLVNESGHSSFEYNQNAYVAHNHLCQSVPLALALSQKVLGRQGAWRLHGGGFAGTIQAFVPNGLLKEYCSRLGGVFGEDACHVLNVRNAGCVKLCHDIL